VATPQDYMIAFAAATEWFRDHKVPMPPEAVEQLTETIIDAVDAARERRQRDDL
jgi:hypothetical protein